MDRARKCLTTAYSESALSRCCLHVWSRVPVTKLSVCVCLSVCVSVSLSVCVCLLPLIMCHPEAHLRCAWLVHVSTLSGRVSQCHTVYIYIYIYTLPFQFPWKLPLWFNSFQRCWHICTRVFLSMSLLTQWPIPCTIKTQEGCLSL